MSAPDTNIEKQVVRHKGPLIGFVAVVVAIIFFAVTTGNAPTSDDPEATDQTPALATEG